jgi:hypothetical protein
VIITWETSDVCVINGIVTGSDTDCLEVTECKSSVHNEIINK